MSYIVGTMNNIPFTETDLARLKSLLGGFLMADAIHDQDPETGKYALKDAVALGVLMKMDIPTLVSICLEHCYGSPDSATPEWVESVMADPKALEKNCREYEVSEWHR